MPGRDRSTQVAEVRTATRSDIESLVLLVKQYWGFEAIEGFDPGRITALLERVLADPSLGRVWVATVGDDPVGYLLAVFVFSLEYQGLTAEVDELFVVSRFRGAGIGARLLSVAEQAFRAAGCTRVFLQIGRANAEARAFYRAHGFGDRAGFDLIDKALA